MVDGDEENWRDREASLEFAVLELATVERAMNANFCMKREKITRAEGNYLSIRAEVTCLRGMHSDD